MVKDVRTGLAEYAPLDEQVVKAYEFAQSGYLFDPLPVLAVERAVLAVDHDQIGPLVKVDREDAEHFVKARVVLPFSLSKSSKSIRSSTSRPRRSNDKY